MLIDCDGCAMQGTRGQGTPHCRDCVVTWLIEPRPREGGVVVDVEEERALRELARAGLVPEIPLRSRAQPA